MGAHRVAWESANGPIPACLMVCHRCDNPACCNPSHLFLGTNRDNVDDMVAKGRAPGGSARGESHGLSKLTAEWVREIRRIWQGGRTKQRDLADLYGVDQQVIWSVVNRRTWKHVE